MGVASRRERCEPGSDELVRQLQAAVEKVGACNALREPAAFRLKNKIEGAGTCPPTRWKTIARVALGQ